VVDLVIETESIGIQDDTVLDSLLENSDNTKEVNEIQKEAQNLGIRDKQTLEAVFRNADKVVELKSVINDAKALDIYDLDHIAPVLLNAYQVVSLKKVIEASDEVGAKDKENLGAVFQNADKADELKEVIDVARETLGANDGLGGKKFDYSKASILSSTLKNADKAAELKSVLAIAKDLGVQDEEHLTSVFVNAGNARDLITVCYAAVDTFGFNDASGIKKLDSSKASILSSTLKNADKASQLKQVIDVSIELGINDAENLKPVFLNSEQATDLLEVITAADEAGFEDKDTLTVVFQNSDRANDLMAVIEKTREINVQEAVELSSAFEVSLKVLDSKDFLTKEEIASLLSSQNGRLEDSNLSLAVDPEILILISELDEYSPSLPTYETAEVSINTEIEVSSSLLE